MQRDLCLDEVAPKHERQSKERNVTRVVLIAVLVRISPEMTEGECPENESAHERHIDGSHDARLHRSEHAAQNSTQDNDRRQQRPKGLPERRNQLP